IAEAGNWREGLQRWHDEMMTVYTAHPWMLDLPITGIPSTPANFAWMDTALTLLSTTGLDPVENTAVLLMMTGHARWRAIVDRGYQEQARASEMSTDDLDRQIAERIDRLVTAEHFPHLRTAIDAGVFTTDANPLPFGLERMLDGVALYISSRGDGARSEMPHEPQQPPATDAFPKDPQVRAACAARREAEKTAREAQKKVREAVNRDRDAGQRAREREMTERERTGDGRRRQRSAPHAAPATALDHTQGPPRPPTQHRGPRPPTPRWPSRRPALHQLGREDARFGRCGLSIEHRQQRLARRGHHLHQRVVHGGQSR